MVIGSSCGFFRIDASEPSSWDPLWKSSQSYSVNSGDNSLFLFDYADGKVRRYDSDFRLQKEWDIPGAYRSDVDNGILWVSSVTDESVWKIEGEAATRFPVPKRYTTLPEELYLNDVTWSGEALLFSDWHNSRILILTPDVSGEGRWVDVSLNAESEPTLWVERKQSPPLVISQSDGLLYSVSRQ